LTGSTTGKPRLAVRDEEKADEGEEKVDFL
jgi:hypothetical protein